MLEADGEEHVPEIIDAGEFAQTEEVAVLAETERGYVMA